jgi:uncharacterized membrane protein (DUF4010 family)
MDLETTFFKLALALGLGLLMGLQRQRVDSRLAGIRTFPLIAVFGALRALTAPAFGPWLVAAGLVALGLLLLIANLIKLRQADANPGMTTEVAVLLTYGLGAYLVVGHTEVAVALAGVSVLLLYLKDPMHRMVGAMSERDVTAVMQFALVTMVVLPVLPDRSFGPYEVLNPFRIWLMVVLIVAINLAGFVVHKLTAAQTGALLGGVVGGLVSSTATTVSYARRSRGKDTDASAGSTAALATLVIVVASTVSLLRVLVEIAVVAPRHFLDIGAPLGALLGWMAILALLAWWRGRRGQADEVSEPGNPAELKPALLFGALYALVILAVAFVKDRFGDAGLYPVALLSGMTDVDAITLSTVNLAEAGRLEAKIGARLILLAVLANLAFKGGCAMVLGSAALRARIGGYFGLALAGGVAILLLWR